MVITRSKARLLEQATNDGGLNEQSTTVAQDPTLASRHPAGPVVCRGAARGAADNNAPTHGKDTESNGALIPQTSEENELSLTGSDSTAAPKADAITRDDGHAQDQSVILATSVTDVSGQRAPLSNDHEVLSDATNKAASTSSANKTKKTTRPRARRGRKPGCRRGKKCLAVAEERAPQTEFFKKTECTIAGSTSSAIDAPSKTRILNDSLPTPLDNSANALSIPSARDDAPKGCKGKHRMIVSPESSEEGMLEKSDKQADAVDALLRLWSSRSPTQAWSDRPSGTGASRSAEETSTPPRRSYRLGVKRELKEKREKEEQELEQQEKERRERKKQEKAKEKAKETRNTGDKTDDAKTKKDKTAQTPAPRVATNITKRKRQVADVENVEDASKEIGPQRKRAAFSPQEEARYETERPWQDRCSPASYAGTSCGSTDAVEPSDARDTSESIGISGIMDASPIRERLEPFDVKRRIRYYTRVSESRSTLKESDYEDPLDEDNALSPVPVYRRIVPPPSEVGFPSQPYHSTRLLSLQLEKVWRPET